MSTRRRGNNEGTIVQRADGRWAAAVTVEGRKRKWIYGKTRREVQQKLTAAVRAQDLGIRLHTADVSTGVFMRRWLDEVVKHRVRPRTFESYEMWVERHITPAIGRVALGKLNPQHVSGILEQKRQEGLSPRSVQYLHTVLKLALKQAERWELVPRNVARLVDSPRVQRQEVVPLTPEQARTFLESIVGHRLEALFVLTLTLGLRMGEVMGLQWEDVDLDRRTLVVRKSLQRIGGKLVLVEPKTEKSRRTLALPTMVAVALKAHRRNQLEERLLAGNRWKEHGMVFPSTIGTPCDGRETRKKFVAALEAAGLPKQRFHDLRHACASFLIAQGAHPKEIQSLLGHSTIVLTMDTYGHLFEPSKRGLADKMDALLSEA